MPFPIFTDDRNSRIFSIRQYAFFQASPFSFFLPSCCAYWQCFVVIANERSYYWWPSYVFYMWWNPAFILLIILSTLVDYQVGRHLETTTLPAKRRLLLILSLCTKPGYAWRLQILQFLSGQSLVVLETCVWAHTILDHNQHHPSRRHFVLYVPDHELHD